MASIANSDFASIAFKFHRRVYNIPFYSTIDEAGEIFSSPTSPTLVGWVAVFFYFDGTALQMFITDLKTTHCYHTFENSSTLKYGSLNVPVVQFLSLILPTLDLDQKHLVYYSHIHDTETSKAFPLLSSMSTSTTGSGTLPHQQQTLLSSRSTLSAKPHSIGASSSLHLVKRTKTRTSTTHGSQMVSLKCPIPVDISQFGNAYTNEYVDGPLVQLLHHQSTSKYTFSIAYSINSFDLVTGVPLTLINNKELPRDYLPHLSLLMLSSMALIHQYDLLAAPTSARSLSPHPSQSDGQPIAPIESAHNGVSPQLPGIAAASSDTSSSDQMKTLQNQHQKQIVSLSDQIRILQQKCGALEQKVAHKDQASNQLQQQIVSMEKDAQEYKNLIMSIIQQAHEHAMSPVEHRSNVADLVANSSSLGEIRTLVQGYIDRLNNPSFYTIDDSNDLGPHSNLNPSDQPTTAGTRSSPLRTTRTQPRRLFGYSNISRRVRARQTYLDDEDEDSED